MNRRGLLVALGASMALLPGVGIAQTPTKRALIVFLVSASKAEGRRYHDNLPQGMQELGYVEGRDYAFEARYADGDLTRLPPLAHELVRLKPDVIVAENTAATLAAHRATSTVPIVSATITDPVGLGLALSEANPGKNVTGILSRVDGLTGKQQELAIDLMPTLAKIGILVNASNPTNLIQRREAEIAAAKLRVPLAAVEVNASDGIGPAFQRLSRENASFVLVLTDAMFLAQRRRIAAEALATRLPTVHAYREHVEVGSLISYGIDVRQNFRRVAYYVHRILKGESPAKLPIEFPTKLELVINLATAKALRLTIPSALLARADEVIE